MSTPQRHRSRLRRPLSWQRTRRRQCGAAQQRLIWEARRAVPLRARCACCHLLLPARCPPSTHVIRRHLRALGLAAVGVDHGDIFVAQRTASGSSRHSSGSGSTPRVSSLLGQAGRNHRIKVCGYVLVPMAQTGCAGGGSDGRLQRAPRGERAARQWSSRHTGRRFARLLPLGAWGAPQKRAPRWQRPRLSATNPHCRPRCRQTAGCPLTAVRPRALPAHAPAHCTPRAACKPPRGPTSLQQLAGCKLGYMQGSCSGLVPRPAERPHQAAVPPKK